jgi:hypothetical protein
VLLDLLGDNDTGDILSPTSNIISSVTKIESTLNEKNNQNLLDLLGGLDTLTLSTPTATITPVLTSMLDPLDLIGSGGGLVGLGGGGGNNILTTNNTSNILIDGNNIMGDFSFGNVEVNFKFFFLKKEVILFNLLIFQMPSMPKMVALDKNGVLVELLPKKGPGYLQILMVAKNNTLETLEQYLFQVSCLGRFEKKFQKCMTNKNRQICLFFLFLILARVFILQNNIVSGGCS